MRYKPFDDIISHIFYSSISLGEISKLLRSGVHHASPLWVGIGRLYIGFRIYILTSEYVSVK